jgi:hypothetical protein
MSDAPYGLSKEASIQAHLRIAKKAIENGESDLRRAADHLAQAQEKGISQREIASAVGKSVSWVNGLLQWAKSGYEDKTPFGPGSKARRERARVRANERARTTKQPGRAKQDGLAVTLNGEQAAQVEAAGTRPTAATDEALWRNAEGSGEHVGAEKVGSEGLAPALTAATKFTGDERARLIETLEFLAIERPRLRATFALNVEKRRAELGLSWDELLISAEGKASSAVLDPKHGDQHTGVEGCVNGMPDIPEFLRRDKARVTYGQIRDEWYRCEDLILGLDPKDQQRIVAECVAPFVAARQSPPEESNEFCEDATRCLPRKEAVHGE